jgi:DNA-directed RNA polymerase specialized sigma subunit
MSELKFLINKAKQKDLKAMGELFNKFKPLLKSRAKRYSKWGQKYEDIFQQAALIFILAVYDYQEEKNVPFAGYIKKRINWGLYHYYRRHMQRKIEVPSGLDPISNHH